MVCLDTTFLVDLGRGRQGAVRKMRELVAGRERVVTTMVNMVEFYEGAWAHARAQEKVAEVEGVLEGLVVLDLNLIAAKEFGRLKRDLQRKGEAVGDWDLLIATIALAYGERLILTSNVKDFERIPGIQVVAY
ncbi:MAG: type II toxin-antitoxin system VapC family toxin [Euryarchaeota archaeon]|nr:type II toxin-antitoxin system VapC family toxin [Euryarchaeota archaeon]